MYFVYIQPLLSFYVEYSWVLIEFIVINLLVLGNGNKLCQDLDLILLEVYFRILVTIQILIKFRFILCGGGEGVLTHRTPTFCVRTEVDILHIMVCLCIGQRTNSDITSYI